MVMTDYLRRAVSTSGFDDPSHAPRYAPWGRYLDGTPVRSAPRSAFWGPRGVGDVSPGSSSVTSSAEWPSTYYSRKQRRWLRDLGGTLARAASDVNLADDISDRATPAAAAEKLRAINDLAVQALRVRGERGLI